MKLLVTGREGQLVRSLVEKARAIAGIELLTAGRPEADLELPGSVASAIRSAAPDVVINAAAYTAVDQAEDEPELARRVNAEAAGEAAEAAAALGIPIVQLSTDYVFDGSIEGAYGEDAPAAPINVYGRTKLEGEEAVRRANPDHLIVRTSWVYSPFGRNFVKTIMAAARERDTLSVVDDQRGCPTSALELAEALLLAVDRHRTGPRGTYHLASPTSATWFDVAQHVMAECSRLGLPSAEVKPVASSEWPTRARRPRNSVLDSSRFERDFGYRMRDWRTSVTEVVERLASR
ncbi:MAG TPA: dTDP-4-dehydrorhamnose reductase [Sphingomicrobium sp.]|nr:dTDP-4-dehydrorhamnose reductase [Sphingomicrobium sp.]